jgi:hypothetical protein
MPGSAEFHVPGVVSTKVTPDGLIDDDEYAEIVDDIWSEVENYGTVKDVRVPRPAHGKGHHPGDQANGAERVYVKSVVRVAHSQGRLASSRESDVS